MRSPRQVLQEFPDRQDIDLRNRMFRGAVKHPIIVSFSGIDGAGKSTQISKLCDLLQGSGLQVKQLAFWDNVVAFPGLRAGFSHRFLDSESGIGAPEKPVKRNDKNVRSLPLTIGRSGLFFTDALNLRRRIRDVAREAPDVLVFDRFLYDQLATLPLENVVARRYANFLLDLVPKPDLPIILDAEPDEARRRKPEYPLDFLHRYRATYLTLSKLANLLVIPPHDAENVHQTIARAFQFATGIGLTSTAAA